MDGNCAVCESLWEEYGRLAAERLALNREQVAGGAGGLGLRMPLGQRIQRLAEAQMRVRQRLSAHETVNHRPQPVRLAPMVTRWTSPQT